MRSLSSLYAPESVAVIGASDDTRKWGHWLAKSALKGKHRRTVELVNGHGRTVLGQPARHSLAELAGPIELALIVVPAPAVAASVDESLRAGARAIVVITSCSGDVASRRAHDAELAALVRDSGAVLLGPNCLGVFDASSELELVPIDFPRGAIGFISQSGNLGLELGRLAQARGLGFSRFISLGNQADIDGVTVLGSLLDHAPTKVIALYLEDLRDPDALAAAAAAAVGLGKPVFLMAPDRSAATSRTAASHTGSVPAARSELDALCRAGGIVRVNDSVELIESAAAALAQHPPASARVGIVADGGGHAALAATIAERAGLNVPRLSEALMAQLRPALTASAAVENPIDLAGSGEQDIRSFDRTAIAVMRSGEVAGMLVAGCFGGYGDYSERFAEAELQGAHALAAATTGRPLAVQTMYPESPAAEVLRSYGVFVGPSIVQAVRRLAELLRLNPAVAQLQVVPPSQASV